MGYQVTIKNDSKPFNNIDEGYVHTWLELDDGKGNKTYFGFTPKAGLRFWRFWFLGFIPWERKTVTPASIWQHPALERIYDSPETVGK